MSLPNDGSFMELFLQRQRNQQAVASTSAPVTASAGESLREPAADFEPAASFVGARRGFVFKTGNNGLGYYRDVGLVALMAAQRIAAKAKPVVLKSNRPIVRSGVSAAGAKRAPSEEALDGAAVGKKGKADTSDNSKLPVGKYLQELERYRAMTCGADTTHDRPLVK